MQSHKQTVDRVYLGEVTHNMRSLFIDFSKDVEDEWLNVKVKCFVIQKELRQETQILTVDLQRERQQFHLNMGVIYHIQFCH